MTWKPPIYPMPTLPDPTSQGAFGARRRHDVHTGVDLYCEEGAEVHAVEAGKVVAVVPFTGPDAGSSWWLPTEAVLVQGLSGVALYGEIVPAEGIRVGVTLEAGDVIGHVTRVLRQDKGKPTTMLHFELYDHGTVEPVWWRLDEEKPKTLRDPTPLLQGGILP